MDRQPLLDRLGDKLLPTYPGAAAAYSLQALNGNGDNVVRVRRESDNDERDFTALEVNSGELQNWVNSQIVPPLDIGVETADGRIPTTEGGTSIGTPAAAYSLRNLSTDGTDVTTSGDTDGETTGKYVVQVRRNIDGAKKSFTASEVADGTLDSFVNVILDDKLPLDQATGAAAAYSLRNLSTTYTGNVVEVRRSSDDAERDFTAAELADGTLESWVNTEVSFSAGVDFFTGDPSEVNLTNATKTGFDAEATGSGALIDIRSGSTPYIDVGAGEVTISFTVTNYTFTGVVTADFWTPDGSGTYINAVTITGNGTYTGTVNVTEAGTGSILKFASPGGVTQPSGATYSISDLSLSWTKASGHVATWYDQSGNDNHAIQTDNARQPKIVDAGTLVTGGLDFDGVDDEMDIGGLVLASLNYGAFSVASIDNPTASTLKTIFDSTETNKAGFALAYGNTASKLTPFWFDGDDTTANVFGSGSNLTSSESLYSAIIKSGASTTHINGSLNETLTNTWTTAGTNSFTKSTIGYDQSVSGRNFKGKLKELIIYDSDQSDNRTALEANIGEHYGISGIPAYDNTVNGFVETWYDQSGNGNDAVQLTAANQPKIVDAGSLLNKLKFEGSQFLKRVFTSPLSQPNSAFVVAQMDAGTGNTKIFDGLGVSNRNLLFANNDSDFSMFANTVKKYADRDANENLHTAIFNEDSSLGALNGVATSISGLGSQAAGGLTLGRTHNIDTNFLRGTISELIFYNSDQSANRAAIETNINNRYNIYS